jgi:hypothetical protein
MYFGRQASYIKEILYLRFYYLNGDIRVHRLHRIVFLFAAVAVVAAALITVKVFITVDYCILPGNCYQRTMSSHYLSKDVLKQLQCPFCMQYKLPPITLCGNWHICSSCKQKIQKCPTCRDTLSDTRNKALEKLALPVECPCHNKPHGCTLTFPIALIREHEDVCQFGPFDCPLNYHIKCNWRGPLTEIKGHVLHKHKELLGRPYVRMLGLTKPTVRKFNEDKIYVDILL